jgi:hypothetical protein
MFKIGTYITGIFQKSAFNNVENLLEYVRKSKIIFECLRSG